MPGATVLGDICSGHGSFPPRPVISASGNVIINGKGVVRIGDAWAVHCNPVPSCHGGSSAGGSSKVIINGKGAVRIGDAVDCGSTSMGASPNVIIGG